MYFSVKIAIFLLFVQNWQRATEQKWAK
jgi:hypothetical protein